MLDERDVPRVRNNNSRSKYSANIVPQSASPLTVTESPNARYVKFLEFHEDLHYFTLIPLHDQA